LAAQQPFAPESAGAWRLAATTTDGGGSTPCRSAQASRSAGVVQQQLCQHCSALAQPQAWSMHGNGSLRSLRLGVGKGTPVAAIRYPASAMAIAADRAGRK
jgi:hypothetical protein